MSVDKCKICGHEGSSIYVCNPQASKPEEITILKDHVYFAMQALEVGIENTEELLFDHEQRLGRTTRSNRLAAERLENELSNMKSALDGLKMGEI